MAILKPGFLKNNKYFNWFCYFIGALAIVVVMALKILKAFSKSAQKSILNGEFVARFWLSTPPKAFVGAFDSIIGLREQIPLDSVYCKNGELRVLYTIPHDICDNVESDSKVGAGSGTKYKFLSLGGMLALCDELTTVLLMAADKSHRPGVSVQLSGEIAYKSSDKNSSLPACTLDGRALAGRTILCISTVSKIGESLSFTSMKIYSPQSSSDQSKLEKSGPISDDAIKRESDDIVEGSTACTTASIDLSKYTLLADTRHIKFMKMGYLYDSVLGDCLPFLLYQFHKFFPKHFYSRKSNSNSTNNTNSNSSLLDVIRLDPAPSTDTQPTSSYFLQTNQSMLNPFKKVHGGALAIASVSAAMASVDKSDAFVRAMEVNYMSASSVGKLKLDVSRSDVNNKDSSSTSSTSSTLSTSTVSVKFLSEARDLKKKKRANPDEASSEKTFSKNANVSVVLHI